MKTRCPECNTAMQVDFDTDNNGITDKYWFCPECGRCESYTDETESDDMNEAGDGAVAQTP